MADLGLAGLPVPGGGQAPTVPAHLAPLALAIDQHLVQHAVDQADRNAKYSTAPLHTVVAAEDGSVWVKTSATTAVWATVYEPPPAWRPVTLASGMQQTGETTPQVRRIGRRVYLQGRINRVDGLNLTGEVVNLCRVPADCIPTELRTYPGACSLGGTTTDASGRWEILGTNSASAYGDPGDLLWWYQGEGGTPWTDLAGAVWLD
ncbi:hypothetical protein ACFV0R_19130 [Streptomyces sp. NPDC059578]|uniref:hypothetical protein n=1 Tax=Streptomyces sp. NPDC059578 TaxID=3346874 RepID=UPI0036B3B08F